MAERPGSEPAGPLRVLLVDDDDDLRELVEAVLTDEGYEVTALSDTSFDAILAVVGRVEPDCILLDGVHGADFGASWASAEALATRGRPIPTVMFTTHFEAVAEARAGTSDRAVAADFAAVLPKPFGIDALLTAVETAAGRSTRFDRTEAGEQGRTAALIEALRAAGATDIHVGQRREWATFVPSGDQRIHQLFWWQRKGVYVVGRYDEDARLELDGQFFERDAAIAAAVG
jgi:CheY-like chemotaxis protein